MAEQQSFKNHTRWDPIFHYFLMPLLVLNVILTSVYYANHRVDHRHIGPWAIVMSIVVIVAVERIRGYSLKVQDRVIRLEEQHRLATLCSPAELAELDSLTVKQYVALRFASNTELPELARRAVRENMEPKDIKAAIKSWRPDYNRV